MANSPVYPILVVLVMGYAYFAYTLFTVYPQIVTLSSGDLSNPDPGYAHGGLDSVGSVVTVFVFFNLIFFMAMWSFVQAMITDPGSIPKTARWIKAEFGISKETEEKFKSLLENRDAEPDSQPNIDLVRSLPVVERKKKDAQYRFCTSCNIYKPDRAHHCRICDRCVLRMDHHCPWIANCVGFYNYKFFLLFLFYDILAAIFIVFAMFPRMIHVFRPMINVTYWCTHDLFAIIAYLFVLIVVVVLSIFLSFHIKLTLGAMTTIELREKHDKADTRHQFDVAHKKFDRGSLGNWLHVFGPSHLWFFPIQPRKEGEGLYDSTTANPPKEDQCC